jgi:signal transduction histidine kinase
LLASTTDQDRQARTRNRCNSEGYESVALIPLRSGSEIIGLLQLNDRRPNRFTEESVRFFEGLGASIGIALSRKRLEQERVALEFQLRQQQKLEAIGTLASGVAHEINNPINGILNYAQLIEDTAAPESRAAEFAKEIMHETERVATIVRNLLQFARQEKETHSPARPADIVEQTLSLLRAVLRRDQIALTVDVPETLPALKCRSQQLQQVLMNLLTNARDALNAKYPGYHGDKTLAARAVLFEQDGRPWLRFTVADQGPGIPPEIQSRIFDPFFTTKPRDKGTGLGLSISHGIVKDHHGRLHFETAPGTGTQFHFDLPVDNGWTVEGK